MATNTTNYNLVKPAYADTADIADINGNMDVIDGQMKTNANNISSNGTAISNVQDGLAIVATGNTHAAIPAGRFVYIKNHGSLADGLYKNTSGSTISANATLSSSNVTADSTGGLNALANDIATLSSNLTTLITPEVATFTPVANVSIGMGGVFKVGKVVYFNLRLDLSTSIINGMVGTFGILPKRASGLTANDYIVVAVTGRDGSNSNIPMYGILNALNGECSIYPSDSLTPSTGVYTITGFYVID